MTPLQALDHQAQVNAGSAAFTAAGKVWTYRDLAGQSLQVACALLARGIRAGDRIALQMTNRPEMAIAYYACFRIGAIAVPLNLRYKTAELRPLLQRLRPALYIGEAPFYRQVAGIEPDILPADSRVLVEDGDRQDAGRSWTSLLGGSAGSLPGDCSHADPHEDAVAVLLATSGTTGQPKFVAHTQASLGATAEAFSHLGIGGGQVMLGMLPMVHVSGFSTFLACIRFGVPLALLAQFEPGAALDAIQSHRCTTLIALPFMAGALLQSQAEQARDTSSLRLCLTAGDVCPPDIQTAFRNATGVPLGSFWAASEVVGALVAGRHAGAASRVAPGVKVRLVDDAGADVAPGTDGELLIQAPSLAAGYWIGPDHIESLLHEGWFRTGDIMRWGDGDDLLFVARRKQLIVRAGSNISPIEVEQALRDNLAVSDAAVLGVDDEQLGQRVVALVTMTTDEGGSALDDIRAEVTGRLADYKVPEHLYAVNSIPKNTAGKTDYKTAQDKLDELTS